MRLVGYRPHAVTPGVELWEARTFHVPLQRVLERRLVSAEGRAWLDELHPHDRGHERTLPEKHGPVGCRAADGTEKRFEQGLVVSSSFSALLEFLTTSYLPLADGQCERLCRRAAAEKTPHDAFRREMEQLVIRSQARWHPSRLRRNESDASSPILLLGSAEDVPGDRFETSTGLGVFLVEDYLVLARDFVVAYRGLPVPRRAWAMISRHPTEPVLAWNGATVLYAPQTRLLPSGFLEELDRDGTSVADLPVPCIGAPELEVRFLLGVPPDDELAAVKEKLPREPALRCGAFLFDSRSAVALPPDSTMIPVVADLAQVRYVLSRTTPTGLYVPTAPPSPSPVAGKGGRVLLGALPRFPS
ncbi:MAG: hypothetical protein HY905_20955 [Deltaproteobacteria bacterium]|nr:hypothetical protein [Deltaproteobacteria bacterium]